MHLVLDPYTALILNYLVYVNTSWPELSLTIWIYYNNMKIYISISGTEWNHFLSVKQALLSFVFCCLESPSGLLWVPSYFLDTYTHGANHA